MNLILTNQVRNIIALQTCADIVTEIKNIVESIGINKYEEIHQIVEGVFQDSGLDIDFETNIRLDDSTDVYLLGNTLADEIMLAGIFAMGELADGYRNGDKIRIQGKNLEFLSVISDDGLTLSDACGMPINKDIFYDLKPLSSKEKTFLASGYRNFIVKIKENRKN